MILRKDLKVGDRFKYRDGNHKTQSGLAASWDSSFLVNEEVILITDGVVAEAKQVPDPKDDLTKSPHYTKLSPEPIEVIEAWDLGFRLANVIKYVARAGRKPGADKKDDLIKARNYLTREINAIDGVSSWESR